MTGAELNKAMWIYRLLATGRANDAREELEELLRSAADPRPGLLSLRGPTAPAQPDLEVIERPVA